jgi:hypothetical protein
MLAVVDDARVVAGDGRAAWSELFNEMFVQAAGVFSNARVRRHGRAYLSACYRTRSGRTPGSSRSSPGMRRRTGCSGC